MLGVRVWFSGPTHPVGPTAISVADGGFELPQQERAICICAYGVGYRPYCKPIGELREDPATGVQIEIEDGSTGSHVIKGRVLDAGNSPVRDALVEAWGRCAEDFAAEDGARFGTRDVPDISSSRSDANGYFELRGLEADSYWLHARKRGYFNPENGNRFAPALTAVDADEDVEFRLQRFFVYSAIAIDASSRQPIRHANYRLAFNGSGCDMIFNANDEGCMMAAHFWMPRAYGFHLGSKETRGTPALVCSCAHLATHLRRRFSCRIPMEMIDTEAQEIPMVRDGASPLTPVRIGAHWPDGRPFWDAGSERPHPHEGALLRSRSVCGWVLRSGYPFPSGYSRASIDFWRRKHLVLGTSGKARHDRNQGDDAQDC